MNMDSLGTGVMPRPFLSWLKGGMPVKTRQGAALERKKFFADPVMVVTIALLMVLLALFILYPLVMLLLDSIYVRETNLVLVSDIQSGAVEVLSLIHI